MRSTPIFDALVQERGWPFYEQPGKFSRHMLWELMQRWEQLDRRDFFDNVSHDRIGSPRAWPSLIDEWIGSPNLKYLARKFNPRGQDT